MIINELINNAKIYIKNYNININFNVDIYNNIVHTVNIFVNTKEIKMRLELKRTGWEFIGNNYAESECDDRLELAIEKAGYLVGEIVYYADCMSERYVKLYCCGEYYYAIYKDNDYYETVTKIYKLDEEEAIKIQSDKNFEFYSDKIEKFEEEIEEKVEENFVEKIKNCFSNFKNSIKKFQKKLSLNIKCFINDTKHYARNFVEKSTSLIKKCKGFYTDVLRPYKKSPKF